MMMKSGVRSQESKTGRQYAVGSRQLLLTVYCLLFTVFMGCAAKMAYNRGDDFASEGKWDEAVIAFTEALQREPENLEYNIRLIMAKERASESHYQKGTAALVQDKLDEAIREFQLFHGQGQIGRAHV